MRKALLLSVKIGLGSALAILIAEGLGLESPAAAGTITLLTLANSKWETLRLAGRRLVLFFVTIGLCWGCFSLLPSVYSAFALFLVLITAITEFLGWQNTLSVNALIGMHVMSIHTFTMDFVLNELSLLLIGLVLAFLLNMVQLGKSEESILFKGIQMSDEKLEHLLFDLSETLQHRESTRDFFRHGKQLEKEILNLLAIAKEHERNTFSPATEYFVRYFETRLAQTEILIQLHAMARQIEQIPEGVEAITEYIRQIAEQVCLSDEPGHLLQEQARLVRALENSPLPKTRAEFESQALILRILSDTRDFLVLKEHFIRHLSDIQKDLYVHRSAKSGVKKGWFSLSICL